MEPAFGVAVQEEGRHGHGIYARVDNNIVYGSTTLYQ